MMFQSTPPMQGATVQLVNSETVVDMVSIHAPYAGSDSAKEARVLAAEVSIHAPLCRERRRSRMEESSFWMFQSTPPMQGATVFPENSLASKVFQSTPPMQGATKASKSPLTRTNSFNPRPLCRERPQCYIL